KSSKRRSAYLVIFNIHCFIGFLTTGCPPRSLLPSITSSLARTVPSAGHQFTFTSSMYASQCSYILRNIHCVHLLYSGSVVLISQSQSYEKPNSLSCLLNVSIFSFVNSAGLFPESIAYCSAGNPKASHPIGCNTSLPSMRLILEMISVAV